jgi:glycine dehydrogenase
MHDSTAISPRPELLPPCDSFARRHLGSNTEEIAQMLALLGRSSLDGLIDEAVPAKIRLNRPLALAAGEGEHAALAELRSIAAKNRVTKSYLGQGYSDCITPPVIQRNILENPGWYTAYTPYQAEISQGRMEALVNFQQMVIDLTGLDIANASLLDEATAAAEAMHMAHALCKDDAVRTIFVSERCHPQTIAVMQTRCEPLGLKVLVGDEGAFDFSEKVFAVVLQYPDTTGAIHDYAAFIEQAHQAGALAIVAADILALTLLRPPGEFGADIAVGSTQRFGVPLGFGGPHAGYMAVKDEFKRLMPGRLIGVSKDAHGHPAYRLSLQTREQHIRRDKATSNICTAQVLLAVMASMYAVYHGPGGLRRIAARTHLLARLLAVGLRDAGHDVGEAAFFDTVAVRLGAGEAEKVIAAAARQGLNLRALDVQTVGVALDETTSSEDVEALLELFRIDLGAVVSKYLGDSEKNLSRLLEVAETQGSALFFDEADALFGKRTEVKASHDRYLSHPVFNKHHTEHEMLRYIRRLEAKDLSLTTSMIPLGSCTMKLNATSEMLPVTWPEFGKLHPFAPADQTAGYSQLCTQLEAWLAEITGFAGVSLEPNAGSQGEYAGLLVIHKYHESRGEGHRDICLIPTSAHGTNPASAVMAGMKVVTVTCSANGDIDLADLRAKAEQHAQNLAALMVTYPSTHGVFEETIVEICELIHRHGGQVYMDGANMNAQVGLTSPGHIGADVCHLNLHKTFCIPHGGGGPGMGPIGVAEHLVPLLPKRVTQAPGRCAGDSQAGGPAHVGAVSAAPFGSASILTISWMYIRMMGGEGLTEATKLAILNANYVAQRLEPFFPVLYKGVGGLVAHECILDLRSFKGTTAEDVAKRLMDFGFHAPTLSWPVVGTLMIEPTESESKDELDRFCDAMIAIHAEMTAVETGVFDKTNNPLKNAPHTALTVMATEWTRPYPREQAAYPAGWLREHKFWPSVGRIDNVWGDRNLFCACVPITAVSSS